MGPYAFEWGKLLSCHLEGNCQMDRILIILKTNGPRTSSASAQGLNTIIFNMPQISGERLQDYWSSGLTLQVPTMYILT